MLHEQKYCEMSEVMDLTADEIAHIVHRKSSQTSNNAVEIDPLQNNEETATDSSTQED